MGGGNLAVAHVADMTSVSIAPGRRPFWLVAARPTLTPARKSRRRFGDMSFAKAAHPTTSVTGAT
ncbi:Uncharacterised protein [Mycobacteroides abscessus]|nr:Uncharacterised protein [Mycobacteroides abscessus]SKV92885.1 Uncharacterised protein [Mycobacteroides abscessus subsp. abscessus]